MRGSDPKIFMNEPVFDFSLFKCGQDIAGAEQSFHSGVCVDSFMIFRVWKKSCPRVKG